MWFGNRPQDAPKVIHVRFAANYWSGMHTAAFYVVNKCACDLHLKHAIFLGFTTSIHLVKSLQKTQAKLER